MTRAISNLIRLHAWRIDEHRRAVATASRCVEELSGALIALEEAIRRERESLRRALDHGLFGFGAYAEHVRTQRHDLRAALAAAEDELAGTRRQLAEAYREARKFELLKADLDRTAARATARREQAHLDEAAAIMRRTTTVP